MWTNIKAWVNKMTDRQHKIIMWLITGMWVWAMVFGDADVKRGGSVVFMASWAVFGASGVAKKFTDLKK